MRTLPDLCLRYRQNSDFQCIPCNKNFKSRAAILQHLANSQKEDLHAREKNHACRSCNKSFCSKEDYVFHIETSDVHINSFHNCICLGENSQSLKLYRNVEDFNRKCRSHDTADDNEEKDVGFSPLHCAILNSKVFCVKQLLKWGANANLKDGLGWTPLHIAAAKGLVKIIMTLLNYGGNLFELDNENQTPFDVASYQTKQEILQKIFCYQEVNGKIIEARIKDMRLAQLIIVQFEKFKMIADIPEVPSQPEDRQVFPIRSPCTADEDHLVVSTVMTMEYDELVCSEITKSIYNEVLEHGKERITHAKVLVLGPVEAGKTSLVRSLSGEEFSPERVKTQGINRICVDTVNLDHSWHVVEDSGWKFDEAVARQVASYLLKSLEMGNPVCITKKMKQLAVTDSTSSPMTASSKPMSLEQPVKEKILTKLQCPEDAKEQFKLSIWDFAGDDVYETMHHIFFSAKAMYLLVFNLVQFKKDQETTIDQLNFWLNSIAAHKSACEPAVFVVATHVDLASQEVLENASDLIKARLFPKFLNFFVASSDVSMVFPIDNTKGPLDDKLKALQSAIQTEAQGSADCADEMALRWLECEKKLHVLIHEDHCVFSKTKEELCEILSATGPPFQEEFQDMLVQFHDSGVLWLPELIVKNPTSIGNFKDVVILNIQHLMNAMAVICQLANKDVHITDRNHRKIAKTLKEDAKISHSSLEKLWDKCLAPCDQVIELLKIFNILLPAKGANKNDTGLSQQLVPACTSTPNAKTASRDSDIWYIIPSLLPERSLDSVWQRTCANEQQLFFYIDFFEFVPLSVFHQLLVQAAVSSGGLDPYLRRFDGIFGFDDRFTYRLQFISSHCQVQGSLVRPRDSAQPGEILVELRKILGCVCDNFFRFQKFKIGPKCPSADCPGSKPDGTKIKSHDVDQTDSGVKARPFIIDLDPGAPRTIYCSTRKVHEDPEVMLWNLKADHDQNTDDSSNPDGSGYSQSMSVDSGVSEALSASFSVIDMDIKNIVARNIGSDWDNLGRQLKFWKDTDVDALIARVERDGKNEEDKAYKLLTQWQQNGGDDATVDKLKQGLDSCNRSDIADKLGKFSFSQS